VPEVFVFYGKATNSEQRNHNKIVGVEFKKAEKLWHIFGLEFLGNAPWFVMPSCLVEGGGKHGKNN